MNQEPTYIIDAGEERETNRGAFPTPFEGLRACHPTLFTHCTPWLLATDPLINRLISGLYP